MYLLANIFYDCDQNKKIGALKQNYLIPNETELDFYCIVTLECDSTGI